MPEDPWKQKPETGSLKKKSGDIKEKKDMADKKVIFKEDKKEPKKGKSEKSQTRSSRRHKRKKVTIKSVVSFIGTGALIGVAAVAAFVVATRLAKKLD